MSRRAGPGGSSSFASSSNIYGGLGGGSGGAGDSGKLLPLVDCPRCNLRVLELKSDTCKNPGRIFYKCPNHHKEHSECPERFYKWEEVYEEYLREISSKGKNAGGPASQEQKMKIDPDYPRSVDPSHVENHLQIEQVYELLCGIQQMNSEVLCVVNSNSRQIGNIVAVGVSVTCGIFVLMMCLLLLVVVMKLI